MKKYAFSLLMLFIPLLVLGTEENNTTVHPLIEKFDKNKDGMIFYTEAPKELQEVFCQYDVNQDAYIDEFEVEAIK